MISKSTLLIDSTDFKDLIFDFEVEEIAPDITNEFSISFHNCIFKKKAIFKNIDSDYISFINCKFHSTINLESLSANTLIIGGCTFDDRLVLSNNDIAEKVNIEKCNSEEPIIISGNYNILLIWSNQAKFINILDVNPESNYAESSIEFLGDNNIEKLEIEPSSTESKIIFRHKGNYKNIFFRGTFNNQILFEGKIITEYLFFESSTFNDRIDIQEGIFENINFYRSLFKGLIWVNGYDILNKERKSLEIENLTLHSNTFDRNVTISIPILKYVNLSNNYFKKLFQIQSKLSELIEHEYDISISIDGTNQGNILIQEAQLNLDISGINLGNINFKDIVFSDLYIRDFYNKGSVSFFNILAGSRFTIEDSSVGKLEFLNTDTNEFDEIVIANSNIENINFSTYPRKIRSYSRNPKVGYGIKNTSDNTTNLKHVYKQLKQVAIRKGDVDISNKYKSSEYKQLLLDKRIGFDKLLLFLNWISNDNGRSWFRGILFTLVTSFLFFCLYLHVLEVKFDKTNHFQEYVLFITSFPKLQLEKYNELSSNDWQISLVIWLARILVSYGIYQTVAAFRKYGKG